MSNIRHFFDQLAPSYAQKYSSAQPFLHYFFSQRLKLATEGLDLSGKTILDIGAGNGALYDFLLQQFPDLDYYACDLSEAMLEESNIPEERRFVSEAQDIDWPVGTFDYIFGLGLTTYLSPGALDQLVDFCKEKMKPESRLILSFTNRSAWEVRLRRWLHPLVQKTVRRPDRVFSQSFPTYSYRLGQIEQVFVTKKLYTCTKKWLLPTIPFLHHLLPKLAVNISKRLKYLTLLESSLCNEFILSFQANGTKTTLPKTGS